MPKSSPLRSQHQEKMGVCESRKQAFPSANPGSRECYLWAEQIHLYLLVGNLCHKVAVALLQTV